MCSLAHTMTSADFCSITKTGWQTSQGKFISFHSCSLCIYMLTFCVVLDFCLFSNIIHVSLPLIQFLFVGSSVCLQLPSDSTSQWTPLLLANDTNYNAHSGLAPYR